jgi:molecular chaperone GrpE
MGTRDENDPLDSLFADALKAVEKVTEKNSEQEDDTTAPQIEFEIEFIEDEQDENIAEDELGIDIDFDEELPNEGFEAELEMRLMAKDEELQHMQTNLKKALRGIKKKKKENETLSLRMELMQKEIGRLRVSNQQAARQLEIVESRSSSSREALDAANKRIDQLNDALQKHQYQLERNQNLRRKEVKEAKKFGISPAILKFIPCIDNLELALKHADSDSNSLREGLRISLNQFINTLSLLGVNKVNAQSDVEFNPEYHEAVMRIPHMTIAPNHIVECFSEGYILHERLLRAAKVSVASKSTQPTDGTNITQEDSQERTVEESDLSETED